MGRAGRQKLAHLARFLVQVCLDIFSPLCAGIHVCCAADQLSPLPGPQDRVKPQPGPVLPLPLAGLADQSYNSSPTFLITWTGSHVAVVAHSPVHITQLDCHYSQQLKLTVYSYIMGSCAGVVFEGELNSWVEELQCCKNFFSSSPVSCHQQTFTTCEPNSPSRPPA